MIQQDKEILQKFLERFNIPTDYVVVDRYKSMKFIIHPKENCGHNLAHVHIELNDHEEMEVSIDDGKIMNISSKFPAKKAKLTVQFVQDNRDLFIRNWNEFMNGVQISA